MRKYTDHYHYVVSPFVSCCLRGSLSWFLFLSSFFLVPRVSSFSVWLKLVPSICVGIVTFVVTMDPSHGREIHYHLTRAIMDLNTIAGFFLSLNLQLTGMNIHMIHMVAHCVHPSQRQLHTFVPHPASSSTPTLASHGGLPTHMILNPEPHLRPLSIRREPCPIEDRPSPCQPPSRGGIYFIHSSQASYLWTFCPYYCGHISSHHRPTCKRFLVRRRPAQKETAGYEHSNILYDNQNPMSKR